MKVLRDCLRLGWVVAILTFATHAFAQREILSKEAYLTPPQVVTDAVLATRNENVALTNLSPDGRKFLITRNEGLPRLEVAPAGVALEGAPKTAVMRYHRDGRRVISPGGEQTGFRITRLGPGDPGIVRTADDDVAHLLRSPHQIKTIPVDIKPAPECSLQFSRLRPVVPAVCRTKDPPNRPGQFRRFGAEKVVEGDVRAVGKDGDGG